MPTALPLDALEMALWTRDRAGHTDPDGRLEGLVHHSDAGPLLGRHRIADSQAVDPIQAGADPHLDAAGGARFASVGGDVDGDAPQWARSAESMAVSFLGRDKYEARS